MKIIPNFKIIGAVDEKEKVRLINVFNNLYENPLPVPERDKIDYLKTVEQLSILRFVNNETNQLMQSVGVEPFDIPDDRYFRLNKENFLNFFGESHASGVANPMSPRIGLSYENTKSNLTYALTALHETMHFKAMRVWEAYKNKNGKTAMLLVMCGIIAQSSHERDLQNKKYSYFGSLFEATAEWQCELLLKKIFDLPELAEQKKFVGSEEFKILREEAAKKLNVPEHQIISFEDGTPLRFTYYSPRHLLKYVCGEISLALHDKYPTREDVFNEFVRVNFTSDLSIVIKIVNDVFGPTSFKCFEKLVLGDGSRESCMLVYSELEEKRKEVRLGPNQ